MLWDVSILVGGFSSCEAKNSRLYTSSWKLSVTLIISMGKNCKGPLVSTDGCTFTHTFIHISKQYNCRTSYLPKVEGFDPTMVTSETICGKVLFDSWKDEKWVDSPGGQGFTHKNPAEGGAAWFRVWIWIFGRVCGYLCIYMWFYICISCIRTYTLEKNTVRFGSTQTLKGWRLVHLDMEVPHGTLGRW